MFGYIKKYILPLLLAIVTSIGVLYFFGKIDFSDLTKKESTIEDSTKNELNYGEVFRVGDFEYNVIEIEETEALTLDGGSVKIAEDDEKFVVIYFYVKTGDRKNISLIDSMFLMYDEKNKKYKNLNVDLESETFKNPFRIYLENANQSTYLVFSMPKDRTPSVLYVGTNNEYKGKKVGLLGRIKGEKNNDPNGEKYMVIPEVEKD